MLSRKQIENVIGAIVCVVFVAGLMIMSNSQPTLPQTPQVQVEQNPDSAAKGQSQSTQQATPAEQKATVQQQHTADDTQRQRNDDAEKRAEEASEYGVFFGRRLKITDFLLAIFTGLLVVVGIGQGIFLYRTDQGTHKAADAAQKAADVAERTLLATQRPMIAGIERWQNFATVDNQGHVSEWTFRGIIKNTGGSEALNSRSAVTLTIRDTDLPSDFDYHDIVTNRPPSQSAIAIHQEHELLNFVIPIEHALAIHRGERKMFFYGWIEYDDRFEGSAKHRTEFAYKIGFPNNPLQTDFHKPMSFDVYGIRYNCVDKGCLYKIGTRPPQEPANLSPGLRYQ